MDADVEAGRAHMAVSGQALRGDQPSVRKKASMISRFSSAVDLLISRWCSQLSIAYAPSPGVPSGLRTCKGIDTNRCAGSSASSRMLPAKTVRTGMPN